MITAACHCGAAVLTGVASIALAGTLDAPGALPIPVSYSGIGLDTLVGPVSRASTWTLTWVRWRRACSRRRWNGLAEIEPVLPSY